MSCGSPSADSNPRLDDSTLQPLHIRKHLLDDEAEVLGCLLPANPEGFHQEVVRLQKHVAVIFAFEQRLLLEKAGVPDDDVVRELVTQKRVQRDLNGDSAQTSRNQDLDVFLGGKIAFCHRLDLVQDILQHFAVVTDQRPLIGGRTMEMSVPYRTSPFFGNTGEANTYGVENQSRRENSIIPFFHSNLPCVKVRAENPPSNRKYSINRV